MGDGAGPPLPRPTTAPDLPLLPPPLPRSAVTAIYAISDVHTDPAYPENWEWAGRLAGEEEYRTAALVVAGDVAESAERVVATLARLAGAFAHIVFVPGNHDLWLRGGTDAMAGDDDDEEGEGGGGGGDGTTTARPPADSVEKWGALEAAIAASLPGRAHTRPVALGGVVLAPLLSWYEGGWNGEPSPAGAPPAPSIFTDFRACRWPAALAPGAGVSTTLAEWWDARNDDPDRADALAAAWEEAPAQRPPPPAGPGRGAHASVRPPLITASHFLPFPALLPERRFLFQPSLADAAGSRALGKRVAGLAPDVHVCGHTHIAMDLQAGPSETRCIHWPLRYPAERRRAAAGGGSPRLKGRSADGPRPALVWDCAAGAAGPLLDTHWSVHYRTSARTPEDVAPAPWVVARAGWAQRGAGGGGVVGS